MTVVEAERILGIKCPTTRNAIKAAYRRRARDEHPDVSEHPQAAERFRRLHEATTLLESEPSALVEEESSALGDRTDDGTLLSYLGLGLGPQTNGRACDDCDGRGYRSYRVERERCDHCDGTGTRHMKTGARLGCRFCNRTGFTAASGRLRHTTCGGCKGLGEVKIYNPVLKKGLLL